MIGYLLCLIVGVFVGFIASVLKARRECRSCVMQEKFTELL